MLGAGADQVLWFVLVQGTLFALCAVHILIFKSDHRAALGWLGLVLVLPLFGAVCYWLFGINRTRRKAQDPDTLRWFDQGALPLAAAGALISADPRRAVGDRVTGTAVRAGNQVRPLFNGEGAYPPMLEAIAAARSEILLSTFIFDADDLGHRFVTALAEAQRRGVTLCVLVDDIGRRYRIPTIVPALRAAGIAVRCFMPVRLLPPSLSINLRNHRKLLLVDRTLAFTGGMNLSARHLVQGALPGCTSDVHFAVTGPVVADLVEIFLGDWTRAGGDAAAARVEAVPGPWTADRGAGCDCRVIEDGPGDKLDRLTLLIGGVLTTAARRIVIVTPYFLPEARLVGVLQSAALRGVAVSVVIPASSNWPLVNWALSHTLWELVNVGVAVYAQPAPFAHSKFLLVDDDYALIGSANLDPRSLRLNYELNLEVFDATLVAQLGAHAEAVIADSRLLDRTVVRQRSLPVRLRDALAALWTPYL